MKDSPVKSSSRIMYFGFRIKAPKPLINFHLMRVIPDAWGWDYLSVWSIKNKNG